MLVPSSSVERASDFARTCPERNKERRARSAAIERWLAWHGIMWRSWGGLPFSPTANPVRKCEIFSRMFNVTILQFHACFNGFVTFAILGWEVFASLLLWFEAGFAYMANDNATACLLWQAMVKGCFVVWKAVGNHTSNFASHPIFSIYVLSREMDAKALLTKHYVLDTLYGNEMLPQLMDQNGIISRFQCQGSQSRWYPSRQGTVPTIFLFCHDLLSVTGVPPLMSLKSICKKVQRLPR